MHNEYNRDRYLYDNFINLLTKAGISSYDFALYKAEVSKYTWFTNEAVSFSPPIIDIEQAVDKAKLLIKLGAPHVDVYLRWSNASRPSKVYFWKVYTVNTTKGYYMNCNKDFKSAQTAIGYMNGVLNLLNLDKKQDGAMLYSKDNNPIPVYTLVNRVSDTEIKIKFKRHIEVYPIVGVLCGIIRGDFAVDDTVVKEIFDDE